MPNVDDQEIKKFSAIADEWWNKDGDFKPLHVINPLRANYIKTKIELENKTYAFICPESQDIVSAAKANGLDLPSSCCSGVCTSCASLVISGSLEQEDAMGLNDELREKGFALLCVAYPKSDLHIIVGDEVEDNLYNNQFGKYQK